MISIILKQKWRAVFRKCLIALKRQNFEKWNYSIDNGSIDNTLKIAKKYKCKIIKYQILLNLITLGLLI